MAFRSRLVLGNKFQCCIVRTNIKTKHTKVFVHLSDCCTLGNGLGFLLPSVEPFGLLNLVLRYLMLQVKNKVRGAIRF